MLYDTAICLSDHVTENGELGVEAKMRVDRTIQLFCQGQTRTLTATGPHRRVHNGITELEAHKRVMLRADIPPSCVYEESDGLDTVGQLFFAKRRIVIPSNLENIAVVSGNYHRKRCEAIARLIYGPDFCVEFQGVEIEASEAQTLKEPKSLRLFLETFRGIKHGDDEASLSCLFERHELYKHDNCLREKYLSDIAHT